MEFQNYYLMRETMDEDIVIGDIRIPRAEISFRFDASSGPGGQNVNKVATKATLRWNVLHSQAWTGNEDVQNRFLDIFENRINKQGELVIQSQSQRSQRQNMYQCIVKLGEMIVKASVFPVARVETQPSLHSKNARLQKKAKQSMKKKERQTYKRLDSLS
jgi:ribosome-associated protein